MNIVIFGAGAIGSLFGGILAKNANVVLIGRKNHVEQIKKKGLRIKGKTNAVVDISAFECVEDVLFSPDLVIISVKSYDTENAVNEIKKILGKNTYVMSLQNGLDNIEKIKKVVDKKRLFVCITTHGSVFSKPGVIIHTGIGKTKIGSIEKNIFVEHKFVDLFNKSGIKTNVSNDIMYDIWAKGVVNSSINPLTCFFKCKNGYILKNPILEKLMEQVCYESVSGAKACGFNLVYEDALDLTKEVIYDTSDNFSSMLQSIQNGCKTEIDSINGYIAKTGKKFGVDVSLNEILVYIVSNLC
ncbi:MAG: 2-dehydropantoate 2-reductase [Candidatus Thermoplasmatota archaeon]|nr:2-dehydropantoate 2-reductase [Candidatus Thermoplasmatota archaeon]